MAAASGEAGERGWGAARGGAYAPPGEVPKSEGWEAQMGGMGPLYHMLPVARGVRWPRPTVATPSEDRLGPTHAWANACGEDSTPGYGKAWAQAVW